VLEVTRDFTLTKVYMDCDRWATTEASATASRVIEREICTKKANGS
jgi:hypothetical protein